MDQDVLKKLKRNELLEIIVRQKKRIEELEEQLRSVDQNGGAIHLSINRIGTWGITLRALAEVFERGEISTASEIRAEAETLAADGRQAEQEAAPATDEDD